MNAEGIEKQVSTQPLGVLQFLWQRKVWWLLPLIVFVLLIGVIYMLGHLSASDPETYPTTLQIISSQLRVC